MKLIPRYLRSENIGSLPELLALLFLTGVLVCLSAAVVWFIFLMFFSLVNLTREIL